jgi:hypothetical protein
MQSVAYAIQQATATITGELQHRCEQINSLQEQVNASRQEADGHLKTANFRARALEVRHKHVQRLEDELALSKQSEARSAKLALQAIRAAEGWAEQASNADDRTELLEEELRVVRDLMRKVASSNASQLVASDDEFAKVSSKFECALTKVTSESASLVEEMHGLVGAWSRGEQPPQDTLTEIQDLLLFEAAATKIAATKIYLNERLGEQPEQSDGMISQKPSFVSRTNKRSSSSSQDLISELNKWVGCKVAQWAIGQANGPRELSYGHGLVHTICTQSSTQKHAENQCYTMYLDYCRGICGQFKDKEQRQALRALQSVFKYLDEHFTNTKDRSQTIRTKNPSSDKLCATQNLKAAAAQIFADPLWIPDYQAAQAAPKRRTAPAQAPKKKAVLASALARIRKQANSARSFATADTGDPMLRQSVSPTSHLAPLNTQENFGTCLLC